MRGGRTDHQDIIWRLQKDDVVGAIEAGAVQEEEEAQAKQVHVLD